ncbi:MAG TPA: hypothetical protein VK915_06925 [Gaiellaceae bacterium]|nr:hypothetical protein [Gaiellaceae bacterium]
MSHPTRHDVRSAGEALRAPEPVGDDYWLRHCHGFRVDSPRGRVGIVEDVLYGADRDRPAALAVRGGVLGRRLALVPLEDVAAVEPRRKRISIGTTS